MGFRERIGRPLALSAIIAAVGAPEVQDARAQGVHQTEPDAIPTDKDNLYNVLNHFKLKDQNGKEINVKALMAAHKDRCVTLSFGFNGCDDYCPKINAALAALDKKRSGIPHFIISVDQIDGLDQQTRNAWMRRLRNEGVKGEIVLLYPADYNQVPAMQKAAGAIANDNNPTQHTAKVALYAPGGKKLDDQLGTTDPAAFTDRWMPLIDAQQGHGR